MSMNDLEHRKDKLYLTQLPSIAYYPLTLIWSAIYGGLAGAFFKLQAVYENWLNINRLQILMWKKYPQRSYKKYISNIWANQVKGQPIEFAEYTKARIEKAYPREPFPFFRLIINTLFMLSISPFMIISGLISGPIFVFKTLLARRKQTNFKKEHR